MGNSKTGNLLKFDILLGLAILILARICCPALSNLPFFTIAFVFVYGAAFILLYFVSIRKLEKEDTLLFLTSVIYTVYIFFRNFFSGYGLFARDSFNAYIIVFLTMIYIWAKGQSESVKVLLLKLIFAGLIFNYVYSIIVLYFDPNASRVAAAVSALEKSPYDVLNAVGSFDAVYGGISVVMILLYMRRTFKEQSVKNKLTLVVLLLALVFIVMASYATAIVLLAFALALFLGSKNKALSAIIILFVVGVLIFHEQFGQWIMDSSGRITYSETVSEKMYEFGYMFKTFETTGTYEGEDGRLARMLWSWDTFKEYPFFGGVGVVGAKVGGHSEILDMLGKFGVIGFTFASGYFIALYNNIKSSLKDAKMVTCLKVVMFTFVIAAVLNPSLYSLQMVPVILMIPFAPYYVNRYIEKKGESK
jgi:hypothetical protein